MVGRGDGIGECKRGGEGRSGREGKGKGSGGKEKGKGGRSLPAYKYLRLHLCEVRVRLVSRETDEIKTLCCVAVNDVISNYQVSCH